MYLFFDTETTGFPQNWNAPVSNSSNWPRMVQLACILSDADGNLLEERNFIIQPEGYTIPAEVAKIHRITTERAKREGVDLSQSLLDFKNLLAKANHLVGHNIEFDEKIIGAEFFRKFKENPLPGKLRICTMKDPRIIAHCALPPYKNGAYKWPKLGELHRKLFRTELREAHDAGIDVAATMRCFFELKRTGII